MRVYREEERFNAKTGISLGKIRVATFDYVCDYCGILIEEDDYERQVQFTYQIREEACMEEVWYYLDKPDNIKVDDMYSYISGLGDEFHYCDGQELEGNCGIMAAGFGDNNSLAMALWEARLQAVRSTEVDYRSLSND